MRASEISYKVIEVGSSQKALAVFVDNLEESS